MNIIKDYLTAGEIRYIANLILPYDNFMDREYIKVLTVADICTDDIKLKKETDKNGEESITWSEEVYNKMWENGDVDELYDKIRNIYLIDDTIAKQENIYNLVKSKLDEISKSIENVKVEELVTNFAKELTNVKDLVEEKK